MPTFTETEYMMLANESSIKGEYIGYFKSSAIPVAPKDQFEAKERSAEISAKIDKIAAEAKLLVSTLP